MRNSTTCLAWLPSMDFRPFGPGYQAKVHEVQYRSVQSQQRLCSRYTARFSNYEEMISVPDLVQVTVFLPLYRFAL